MNTFKMLHYEDDILILPNVWDTLSAIICEQIGFKAIATTSWGFANSLGLQNGEHLSFKDVFTLAKNLVSAVKIPLSIDMESGYSANPNDIVDHVLRLADIGVAGINIEDSCKTDGALKSVKTHRKCIELLRTALEKKGFDHFFINARTDTYLKLENPLNETIERARSYILSGADGIFVPGIVNDEEIKELVNVVDAPINVMALAGFTDVDKIGKLGVKRFSIGNVLSDATVAFIEQNAETFFQTGDVSYLFNKSEIKTVFKTSFS